MKTTFIQIGSRLITIPFWLWLAIIRIQKKYSDVKIWALRRLGIVYDFEGGRTQRAADFACTCRVTSETEMSTNPACPVHGEAAQSR